jgi:hypothetical protein
MRHTIDPDTRDLLAHMSADIWREDVADAFVGIITTGVDDADLPGVIIYGGATGRDVWLPHESMQAVARICDEVPDELGRLEYVEDSGDWVWTLPANPCSIQHLTEDAQPGDRVTLCDMADEGAAVSRWNVTGMGWDWYAPRPQFLTPEGGPSVTFLYSAPRTVDEVRDQMQQARDAFGGLWHLDDNVWHQINVATRAPSYPVWACGWLDLRAADWFEVCRREGVDPFALLLEVENL